MYLTDVNFFSFIFQSYLQEHEKLLSRLASIDLYFHYQIQSLVTISNIISYFSSYYITVVLIALVLTNNSKVQSLLSGFCNCSFRPDTCLSLRTKLFL